MPHSPPDFGARVYGPQRIAAVVATLAEDGVAPARTLAGSGIAESELRAPATRISYEQVAMVFRNAARLAQDPSVAFRAGARMQLTAYGMYGYGLLSSPTHADLVEFTLKYNRVMGPVAVPVSYVRDARVATHTYEVLLTSQPEDPLYRFALEFTFAAHQRLGRDLYGPGFAIAGLSVCYPEPAQEDLALYRALVDGPLRFGQEANTLQVAAPWIDLPSRLPDSITYANVTEMCQQVLAELPRSGAVAAQVRQKLVEQMPWRFPTLESMASAVAMHPRTLRRRLEAEGVSYRDLLADVRRGLALEYLRKTRMTTEEIATRLGYSDAANFRHAFTRWMGRSPQEFRQR